MRTISLGFVLSLLLLGFSSLAAASDSPALALEKSYKIGPGDILNISVWKDEALTKQVTVLPDGTINFPLVGQVQASERTVEQINAEITEKIRRYVPEPNLSVMVHQVNSLLLYVIGKVNKPGILPVNTNINVLQALTMAGGLNPFAKRSEIRIFRQQGEETTILNFDYDKVTEAKELGQNVILRRGDTIVVP